MDHTSGPQNRSPSCPSCPRQLALVALSNSVCKTSIHLSQHSDSASQ